MGRNSNIRRPLSLKLNLLLISVILLITIGLVLISYRVYSITISEHFITQTEMAAQAAKEAILPELVRHLWKEINTDEFRKIREKALNENDEDIIRDWMISKPSGIIILAASADRIDLDVMDLDNPYQSDNLYTDYQLMADQLNELTILFEIADAYIQYDVNEITYNLIDPAENLFYIGSTEYQIDAFADYSGNEYFPPTVYHSEFGWLATTLLPLDKTLD